MILEGLVTTITPEGQLHLAPMGPRVDAPMRTFTLRPFRTAQTYRNLKAHGEGVLHVTDDVYLLARAAVGPVEPFPEVHRAEHILGYILADCCRFYEFTVEALDDREERTTIACAVRREGSVRDFFGFNRAKHAVVEAAILATRLALLPMADVEAEYRRLAVLVEKTGGPQEKAAFAFLQAHVERTRTGGHG